MSISFEVTITNPALTGVGEGFIDNKKIEQYNPTSITTNQAIAKKRANTRYHNIIMVVGMVSNPTVTDIIAEDAGFDSEASTFTMTMSFVSRESLAIVRDDVKIEGEDALKRLIAEALVGDRTITVDYYDATKLVAVTLLEVGELASTPEDAEAFITITEL